MAFTNELWMQKQYCKVVNYLDNIDNVEIMRWTYYAKNDIWTWFHPSLDSGFQWSSHMSDYYNLVKVKDHGM